MRFALRCPAAWRGQVHLGHGYLLSQWLCPLTNRRADGHGAGAAGRARFPLRVVRAVRAAVGPAKAVFVKLNLDDGFPGGVGPADVAALACALAGEPGLVDGIVPSAGFVSKNGFFMLRGAVPRLGMVRALARSSLGKAAALAVLGRWLVPELPFAEGFLLEGAKAVLAAVRDAHAEGCWGGGSGGGGGDTVRRWRGEGNDGGRSGGCSGGAGRRPGVAVLALGGLVSLRGVEGALAHGFGAVQMARALIRQPDLVHRFRRAAAAAAAAAKAKAAAAAAAEVPDSASAVAAAEVAAANAAAADGVSPCTHCNVCVLASLTPEVSSRCHLRPPGDIEDAVRGAERPKKRQRAARA